MLKIAILSLALFGGWVMVHVDRGPKAPDVDSDSVTLVIRAMAES